MLPCLCTWLLIRLVLECVTISITWQCSCTDAKAGLLVCLISSCVLPPCDNWRDFLCRLVPLASSPDFVVDQELLISRSEETQRSCHSCTHKLWELHTEVGEQVLYVCKKRSTVEREGFVICQTPACTSYDNNKLSRKIFCLRCTQLRERGGGAIAFDACFEAMEGGGYRQLLQECLHCKSGSGKMCKHGETDDASCPRIIHNRDHRKPQKRKSPTPDTLPLAPYPYPGLRFMASHLPWLPLPEQWFSAQGLVPEPLPPNIRLPLTYPYHWLFFSPKLPPESTPFHKLLPTSPKHAHGTYLWPFPELPPSESVFYVHPSSCLQPRELGCEPSIQIPGGLSYEPRPPYSSGAFFYGRDPWFFAFFEEERKTPKPEPIKRMKRSAEVKVRHWDSTLRSCEGHSLQQSKVIETGSGKA